MCVVGVTFSVLERAICHGSQEEIAEDSARELASSRDVAT